MAGRGVPDGRNPAGEAPIMRIAKSGATFGLAALACLLIAPIAARADAAFDGTYIGPQHVLLTNNTAGCNQSERPDLRLAVKDNHLRYAWAGNPVLVPIRADGSFKYDTDFQYRDHPVHLSMTGRISGGVLEADAGSAGCRLHMMLKKS